MSVVRWLRLRRKLSLIDLQYAAILDTTTLVNTAPNEIWEGAADPSAPIHPTHREVDLALRTVTLHIAVEAGLDRGALLEGDVSVTNGNLAVPFEIM